MHEHRRRIPYLVVAAAVALAIGCASAAEPTPDVGGGPNHRTGAPFRAKLSPPFAEGTVLVIRGRVLDARSGQPIARAVLDAHHADHQGNYDLAGFNYRGRIVTDEKGQYEFETIRPDSYGPAPHIHLVVEAAGYRQLSTEILFRDAEHRTTAPELTPELRERTVRGHVYLEGVFDIVLEPAG